MPAGDGGVPIHFDGVDRGRVEVRVRVKVRVKGYV